MRDIYHQLVKSTPDFKNFTDEALAESSDLYAAGAFAINSALTLIGNLALDATNAEEYADVMVTNFPAFSRWKDLLKNSLL